MVTTRSQSISRRSFDTSKSVNAFTVEQEENFVVTRSLLRQLKKMSSSRDNIRMTRSKTRFLKNYEKLIPK